MPFGLNFVMFWHGSSKLSIYLPYLPQLLDHAAVASELYVLESTHEDSILAFGDGVFGATCVSGLLPLACINSDDLLDNMHRHKIINVPHPSLSQCEFWGDLVRHSLM